MIDEDTKPVRFQYRELTVPAGKVELKDYSGYIKATDRAGQFVLVDRNGNNPFRFEYCSVVKWY